MGRRILGPNFSGPKLSRLPHLPNPKFCMFITQHPGWAGLDSSLERQHKDKHELKLHILSFPGLYPRASLGDDKQPKWTFYAPHTPWRPCGTQNGPDRRRRQAGIRWMAFSAASCVEEIFCGSWSGLVWNHTLATHVQSEWLSFGDFSNQTRVKVLPHC